MKPTFEKHYLSKEKPEQSQNCKTVHKKTRLQAWILLFIILAIISFLAWNQDVLQLFSDKQKQINNTSLRVNAKNVSRSFQNISKLATVIQTMSQHQTFLRLQKEDFWKKNWAYPVSPEQRAPLISENIPLRFTDASLDVCATGCVPSETKSAWPLRPFNKPRSIISGFNDARPGSFHSGVDIMARDFQKVYALQPGYAHIIAPSGDDARVQVGNYIYWHIIPTVSEGEWVEPLKTVVGKVQKDFGHLHLSEVDSQNQYVNPLRLEQIILPGWTDSVPPVIGKALLKNNQLSIDVYDPQSFLKRNPYITPPIGPAALAYRITQIENKRPFLKAADIKSDEFAELTFSLLGVNNYPGQPLSNVFVYPGETDFSRTLCYSKKQHCPYSWEYWLSKSLSLDQGLYLLSVYAWDWRNNISVRDFYIESNGSESRIIK